MKRRYVGFVIDNLLPSVKSCLKIKCSPRAFFSGWSIDTSVARMRFSWIAEQVNSKAEHGIWYELYRPWRKYTAVVFLKSMNAECLALAKHLNSNGVKTMFDLNVDYLTPFSGTSYYAGMEPTESQRTEAFAMMRLCDAVIADSRHLAKIATQYHKRVKWIPDNIRNDLIGAYRLQESPDAKDRLRLLWSGVAVKAFELLRIRDVLLDMAPDIHLVLITDSLKAIDKWYQPYRIAFKDLLDQLSHEIIPFTSIDDLSKEYGRGGVFISPRFINNSYNRGHTEWKITLAMAQGLMVLCSHQPSYIDVARRARGAGIRICEDETAWRDAFKEIRSGRIDWRREQTAAIRTVMKYYSSSTVADMHAMFLNKLF